MFDVNRTTVTVNNLQRYSQIINIKPACVGTIQKSSPLSRIVKCNINSKFAQDLLDEFNPCIVKEERKYIHADGRVGVGYWDDTKKEYPVIVLQVMVFGDEQCLIEFVYKEDLETVEEIKEEV
jgi:hypothetical protein